MKIIEEQERKKLNEGRNFGIGFSILQETSKNEYKTYNAFTACKDYLNDLCFVEHTKKNLDKIYGFKHDLQNIFDNQEYFLLGIKSLDYNYKTGKPYKYLKELQELIINNREIILYNINTFEKYLKIDNLTEIYDNDDKVLIFKSSIIWTLNGPCISLFTLYIRCICGVKEKISIENFEEFIKTFDKCFIDSDNYLLKNIKEFINGNESFEELKSFTYETASQCSPSFVHNTGISGYLNKLRNEREKDK